MKLAMDPSQPLRPHDNLEEYVTAVHLRIAYLCGLSFEHCCRVVDYFHHKKVHLGIVNEEDVKTAVKATKAWQHNQAGTFDFIAIPQGDGSVIAHIEWGDDMPGDILTYDNEKDAKKHLETLIKNAS